MKKMSAVSEYGAKLPDRIREDIWFIVVTEESNDEPEIRDTSNLGGKYPDVKQQDIWG